MSMTVIVTRNVAEDRYRGFLASCMLEIAPGVYTGLRMTSGVRERIWRVLSEWHGTLRQGTIVMTWSEPGATGGQGIRLLGEPARNLHDSDRIMLVRQALHELS